MEGFIYTEEELAILEKVASGELTTADLRRIAREKVEKLRVEKPWIFTDEE